MVLAVIPARHGSTRLPGKPLLDLGGKALVQRVYENTRAMSVIDDVIVATDDRRIYDHVLAFGGAALMTSPNHPSGTDRVAEAAAAFTQAEIVVNVQGDEPFLSDEAVASVVTAFDEAETDIVTLSSPIREEQSLLSPNVVKVVRSSDGRALYFSRHAIPYLRDVPVGRWIDAGVHQRHIGLYAYRAAVLPRLTNLPVAPLEAHESLEQLRWLAAGMRIRLIEVDEPSPGIDTPADLEAARRRLTNTA